MKTLFVLLLATAALGQSAPTIDKIPAGLVDGKITGKNFGKARGKVYVLARYDMTAFCNSEAGAGSQWLNFYQCKPPGTEAEVPAAAIANWTSTTVSITWSTKIKTAFLKQLRLNPDQGPIGEEFPLDSAQYTVETADGARTAAK